MNLRFSVSKIELYRKFREEAYNGYFSQQDVIDTITGVAPPAGPDADWGTAYHSLIEGKHFSEVEGGLLVHPPELENGIFIPTAEAAPAIWFRLQHPQMVYEVPLWWDCTIGGHNVRVSMRIDGIEGLELHDTKTSKNPMDLQAYADSHQWRLYCLATSAQRFHYDHFHRHILKTGTTIKYQTCSFLPYIGMEKDCRMLIENFIHFCTIHNLLDYVADKKQYSELSF